MSTSQNYPESSLEEEDALAAQEREAHRLAIRENSKQILRESGLADMMQSINKNLLKGRGHFEDYDTFVLFRWGTQSTLRHMWIEVRGSSILFRLHPHRKCAAAAPICDGEYHTITSSMWTDQDFFKAELKKYYDRPVAETSAD